MVKQDRTLLFIIGGIFGLIILAMVFFYLRQDDQAYGSEDTPSGVVRNYVLALQHGDFERAYAYLAETEYRPDSIHFQSDLVANRSWVETTSVQLGEEKIDGDKSLVVIYINHLAGGPFQNTWRETSSAILTRDDQGSWKITQVPYPFWSFAWDQPVKTP